ncbi:flagellar protein FlaG [Paenibacillaceae bacterium]|nr:flagellar protein FlaG [Paenibacillaceae bacterium]
MNLQISFSGSPSAATNSYSQAAKASGEIKQSVKLGIESDKTDTVNAHMSIGEEQLVRNIDRAIKALQGPETAVEISVHEKTRAFMVKVLNKETGELIREIPPEKTLELVAKMMEFAGIIIDERR